MDVSTWMIMFLVMGWLVHYAKLNSDISAYKSIIADLEAKVRELDKTR